MFRHSKLLQLQVIVGFPGRSIGNDNLVSWRQAGGNLHGVIGGLAQYDLNSLDGRAIRSDAEEREGLACASFQRPFHIRDLGGVFPLRRCRRLKGLNALPEAAR